MMHRLTCLGSLTLALCTAAAAGEVRFSAGPTAVKAGDGVKISFTVSAPTDVEVAVLDSAGKIVRHLAAGVLGGKGASPEPLKAGLAQELVWDGRDDFGKPTEKGPFKVRVRAGLGVKLDGFFGENPQHTEDILGMSMDSRGNFHVLSGAEGHSATLSLRSYSSSEGKYLRELIPIPASTDASKLPEQLFAPVPGGHPNPENFNSNLPCFLPLFNGPHCYKGPVQMSVNTDAKGLLHIRRGGLSYGVHCEDGSVAIKPPDDPDLLWPGECRDGKGNKLVCDRKAGVVKTIGSGGQEVGSFSVPGPVSVAANPKTGEVYVLSITGEKAAWGGGRADRIIRKFSGSDKDAKELASLALPESGLGGAMVLDASGKVPRLWAAIGICRGDQCKLRIKKHAAIVRVDDLGAKLEFADSDIRLGGGPVDTVTRLAVHPETDDVVVRGVAADTATFEGLTGKQKKVPFADCTDMAVGLDGNWYVQTGYGFTGPIERYARDWKPLPVPGSSGKKPQVGGIVQARMGSGFGMFGLSADGRGRIYSLQQPNWRCFTGFFLGVIGPDGKGEDFPRMKDNEWLQKRPDIKSALWGPTAVYVGGVRVDRQGNIYIGAKVRPKDDRPPAGFEKSQSYTHLVGSVVKVDPAGGAAIAGSAPPAGQKGLVAYKYYYKAGDVFLEGATKIYPGLGIMAGAPGLGPTTCCCRQPIFELDGWGRLWMPNAVTYSVGVVDNQGNAITSFGAYGNADSRGSGADSPIRKPEIPLGWPEAVGASDKAVYVADVANRRVVRLLKTYVAEGTCEAK